MTMERQAAEVLHIRICYYYITCAMFNVLGCVNCHQSVKQNIVSTNPVTLSNDFFSSSAQA